MPHTSSTRLKSVSPRLLSQSRTSGSSSKWCSSRLCSLTPDTVLTAADSASSLDGSAKASRDLAAEARRVLGGRIDILVNNAGIFPRSTTATTDEATFDEVYGVNVKAPYFLTAAIAPAMAEAGQGAIINLGSWIARLGIPSALYSSTKGAVETLTRAWAAEFGPAGVRVNAISPGVIRTPNPDGSDSGRHPAEQMMRGTPAGGSGTPDAVAHAAVYLASDEAAFVHGTVIDVDGGRTSVAVIAS
jgi:NAD(P)-dependent dehydrogenase (short-subunit alcohol dehydrogenase family)